KVERSPSPSARSSPTPLARSLFHSTASLFAQILAFCSEAHQTASCFVTLFGQDSIAVSGFEKMSPKSLNNRIMARKFLFDKFTLSRSFSSLILSNSADLRFLWSRMHSGAASQMVNMSLELLDLLSQAVQLSHLRINVYNGLVFNFSSPDHIAERQQTQVYVDSLF
ncbi:hypothetical protein BpHYR1_046387, partial [Brachionus plicatilis]